MDVLRFVFDLHQLGAHGAVAFNVLAEHLLRDLDGSPQLCSLWIEDFSVEELGCIGWDHEAHVFHGLLELLGVHDVIFVSVVGLVQLVKVHVLLDERLPNLLQEQGFQALVHLISQILHVDLDASGVLRASHVEEEAAHFGVIEFEILVLRVRESALKLVESHGRSSVWIDEALEVCLCHVSPLDHPSELVDRLVHEILLRNAGEGANQRHVLQLAQLILDEMLLEQIHLIFPQFDAAFGHGALELVFAELLVRMYIDGGEDLADGDELVARPLVPLRDLRQDLLNRL